VILVASSRIMKRKILLENQMHLIAKATRFDNFSAQGETIKSFATAHGMHSFNAKVKKT
jgi:hypothetical protein